MNNKWQLSLQSANMVSVSREILPASKNNVSFVLLDVAFFNDWCPQPAFDKEGILYAVATTT